MQALTRAGLDGVAQTIEIAPPEQAAAYVARLSDLDGCDGLDQIPGLLHAIAAAEAVVVERRQELRRHLARCVERAVDQHGVAAVRRAIGRVK